MKDYYNLPDLPYEYGALDPYISKLQLTIHHDKHHQGYVKNSNELLAKLDEARKKGNEYDVKSTAKSLSYNLGGHILHSLFWKNMAPEGKTGNAGQFGKILEDEFGSPQSFKDEFIKSATKVEGSGWAVLVYDQLIKKLMILQVEKHNLFLAPTLPILMAVDVWEHAYYVDYQNERGKFLEMFWNIINWKEIDRRFGLVK